jgi:TATA-binding protein-associated factor Taf7
MENNMRKSASVLGGSIESAGGTAGWKSEDEDKEDEDNDGDGDGDEDEDEDEDDDNDEWIELVTLPALVLS